ncbi:37S ribosomal protein S24, mitochondrial [Smittium mucronatum]|uniref:37S ribosomal protein S24, mitochondrial n=1 Tax=Smittium mucronatum TaxID=133383 RepID=A0A1R0GS71_9FUNG|nr:37S ribosomal protein S24, mitochondrial [Smittium mucronatum]
MNGILIKNISSAILPRISSGKSILGGYFLSNGYAKKASGGDKAPKASEPVKESEGKKERKHFPTYGRKRRMQYERNRERAFDMNQLEEWKGDDHHILGHWFLNSIRDVRKYVRKEKFEIPTLSEFSKPFAPPQATQILKFQTNRIHGKPDEPLNRRVTMTAKVSDFGLSADDLHVFLLLVGPRYNPVTDMLTMSSDTELTSKLNKKKISDTLDALLSEAKSSKEKYLDVPLMKYKIKARPKLEFPKEWLP